MQTDAIAKILADLPEVQQIALRPWRVHPLLAVVLSQAEALKEIATWAASADALAKQAPAEPPVRLVVADDADRQQGEQEGA